jgi:hypothetical protein
VVAIKAQWSLVGRRLRKRRGWWGECTDREKEERERFEVVSQTLNFCFRFAFVLKTTQQQTKQMQRHVCIKHFGKF